MSEDKSETPGSSDLPEAMVERGQGFSSIWLVPLVAMLVAGALLYRDLRDRGETAEITLPTAEGVEAGKTLVRYRDVVVGTVQSVRLSAGLDQVVLEARMARDSDQVLVEGTRFWVERPRIGPHGISGLTTIVSGAYVALDPGDPKGKPQRRFVGLTDPPQSLRGNEGLALRLRSDVPVLGLTYGTPVLHEGIDVGQVTRIDLSKTGKGIDIEIEVDEAYKDRVHDNSRFWNVSGVEMTAGLHGVDVQAASLEAVLAGGVAFGTPGGARGQAKDGAGFQLFSDQDAAFREYHESQGLQVIVRTRNLGSIANGDRVLYRGVSVGKVLRSALDADARNVDVTLQIEPRFVPLVRSNTVFWNASGASADFGLSGLHVHMASLESVLLGAVAFATPNEPGPPADPSAVFRLADEAKGAWHKWAPVIPLSEAP